MRALKNKNHTKYALNIHVANTKPRITDLSLDLKCKLCKKKKAKTHNQKFGASDSSCNRGSTSTPNTTEGVAYACDRQSGSISKESWGIEINRKPYDQRGANNPPLKGNFQKLAYHKKYSQVRPISEYSPVLVIGSLPLRVFLIGLYMYW